MLYKVDNHGFLSLFLNKYYGISLHPETKDFILIMRYYKFDLRHYIRKHFYDLEWIKKLRMLRNIMDGLIYIHKAKVIHRDFHCGNILCDDENNIVISDLGISKSS